MKDPRDMIIKTLAALFLGIVCVSAGLAIAAHREQPRRWVVVDIDIPVPLRSRPMMPLPSVQGSSAFDAAIMAQTTPVSTIRTATLP